MNRVGARPRAGELGIQATWQWIEVESWAQGNERLSLSFGAGEKTSGEAYKLKEEEKLG